MSSLISKVKFYLYKLHYLVVRLNSHWSRAIQSLIEFLVRIWLLNGESLLIFFNRAHPHLLLQKKNLLEKSRNRKIIFFTFRTLHFIDWFAPIQLALESAFPRKYEVFYIDFSTSLHRIGKGFEYIRFRKQVEERLGELNISHLNHFSHEELLEYSFFPKPSVLITCESIRQESISVRDRIYLPHYILPKASDIGLPSNIRFNHVFLPSIPPYTYKEINQNLEADIKFHNVGYPKLCTTSASSNCFPNSDLPMIIYAPSLDLKLLFETLDKGIIEIFKKMNFFNFLIKLHPSLASRRHYISSFLWQQLKFEEHILIDELSGIQSLAKESSLMIADFGSMGCEYRLRFGKRVVFLETPEEYEGGADLIFRDNFADAICKVQELEKTIVNLMEKGDLSSSELNIMRQKVLSFNGEADKEAAKHIDKICSNT